MLRPYRHFSAAALRVAPLVLVLATACEPQEAPVALSPPPKPDAFYPLSVGGTWTYDSARVVRFITEDGGDARPPIEQRASMTREIVGEEIIAGSRWAVEEERFVGEGAVDTIRSWRRYREDATGLYRADLSVRIPPGGAPQLDTLAAGRRLAYPRERGSTWFLREGDPGSTGTLLAIATVQTVVGPLTALDVAYRLPGDGADDRRRFRYSACGLIGSEVHTEVTAMDAYTGERVLIMSTETAELVRVSPACSLLAVPTR